MGRYATDAMIKRLREGRGMTQDELHVSLAHPMSKERHMSFIAAVSPDRMQIVKFYPEGGAAARFSRSGVRDVCVYCNRHRLFGTKV